MPRELVAKIDKAAGRELRSRSAQVNIFCEEGVYTYEQRLGLAASKESFFNTGVYTPDKTTRS